MNPLLKLAAWVGASVALAFLPLPFVLALAAILLGAALAVLTPAHRRALVLLHVTSLLLGASIYALALPNGPLLQVGPAAFGLHGFLTGLLVTTRLAAFFSLCALASHYIAARDVLPYLARRPFPLYLAGSMIRLLPTLREDARRIREAQSARGHAFGRGFRKARTWLPLLVPLLVATLRRTRDQARALRLAGLAPGGTTAGARTSHRWALVPALAALAVVGRLALISIPGVSLSFFVLFIAGVAYGPRVGLYVGLLSRLTSDFLVSGLNPVFLAMAPVDAFLGLTAGLLGVLVNFGQKTREPYLHAAILAGTTGWMYTVVFSIAADTSTWILYHWVLTGLPGTASGVLWVSLVASGILFNVPSAIFNAVLFATAAYPVLRALRAADLLVATSRPRSGPTAT